MWRGIFVVASVSAAGTLGVLDSALPGGLFTSEGDIVHARTLAFHTLVLFSMFAVFATRSDDASAFRDLFANGWLWLAVAASLALQLAVLYLPPLQRAFNTVPLDGRDWALAVVVASSVVWVLELAKLLRRRPAAGSPAGAV